MHLLSSLRILLGLSLLTTTSLQAQVQSFTVNNTENSGDGSLRQAIEDTIPGNATIINFDPLLDGSTIRLTSELLISASLSIDASSLSEGIIIDGGGNGDFVPDLGETRCFRIDGSSTAAITVEFTNLTIQNGSIQDDDPGANICLLYTSPSPRDQRGSRMPSSA